MTEDEMVGWHHQLEGHEAWLAAVHGVTATKEQEICTALDGPPN